MEVYWVDNNLEKVVSYLDQADISMLVLHYPPSTLTTGYSMLPLMFPACNDPLLRRDSSDTNCIYAPNRLAKVVWSPVQNEAPALFK